MTALAVAAQAPEGKSVWDGVYTEDQSKRGLEVSEAACVPCHGKGLVGDIEGPLAGPGFLGVWSGRNVWELYDKIQSTMPGNNPGTLKPQQLADVVAYILKANEFPAGTTEINNDKEALSQIRIRSQKP